MNGRRIKICFLLLDGKNHTLKDLAKNLNVSERTIRKDIEEINFFFHANRLSQIVLKNSGELSLEEEKKKVFRLFDQMSYYEYSLDREERCLVMTMMLLTAKDRITLNDLADFVYVSRSTIVNDLDALKRVLEEANLLLETQPSKGVRIHINRKSDLAEACKKLVADHLDGVIRFLNRENQRKLEQLTGESILSRSKEVSKQIKEAEIDANAFLTRHSFLVLKNFLTLYLTAKPKACSVISPLQGEGFRQILLKKISAEAAISLDQDDVASIFDLIDILNFSRKAYAKRDLLQTHIVTRKFIEAVSDELKIDLNDDYELFDTLSKHLSSIINDPINKIQEYGKISEYIKSYPSFVDVVKNNKWIIEQFTGRKLNEIEIDFIVIYIITAIEKKKNEIVNMKVLIVCAEGLGVSYLVMEKIRMILPEASLEMASFHNYKEKLCSLRPDLVVSDITLDPGIDYLRIGPFLTAEERFRLIKRIDEIKLQKIFDHGNDEAIPKEKPIKSMEELAKFPRLRDFLSEELINLNVSAADWREAVKKSAEPLLSEGYVEEKYVDAMIQNIELHGSYIVVSKGFAIPHASSDQGVIKPGMSLIHLKQPVVFGAGDNDPIEFVACLAPKGNSHIRAFFNLVNGLKNPEIKDGLFQSRTAQEVHRILERID